MAIINIRESLLALDKKTSGKYELTTLYEACKLDEKDKEQLVKYIDTKEPPFMIGQFLTDKCGSCLGEAVEDDATEAEKLKFIDDINDGDDHTLWALMDKADEVDNKLTEDKEWRTNPANSKEVSRYVYRKISPFDEFTDDNSRYWDFDRCVVDGDDAQLVDKAPTDAKYSFSFVNDEVDIDMYISRGAQGDVWYVVDNKPVKEEGLLDVNVPINITANNNQVPFLGGSITEDYDVVTMNDKYFPRVDINDTARYDYVQYKGRDFAYDKKDNVLHFLFKDEEEIEVMGGIEKTPFRSLDAAGLSADNWNDTEERDSYLDQYASDIDAETSYLVQDFIQNELPYYQKQGLVDSLDTDNTDELEEATATVERPLSALGGTLSSVLLAHKDEVDTLFTAKDAIEFLDRIRPEVKNVGYVDKVKADIMRKRGIIPVQYFYNIILKGDGEGTEKGGVVSKKSQIKKWASQPAMESVEDEDKPYTYKQVFDELKLETKDFTVEEGAGKYGYESEANHAVKILEKHYASVELDTVGSWFQVGFKDRLKKSVKEGLNDYRFEVTCNDGPTKVISTVAEDEERAINYVKKYYAQEHTTYADDRANKWTIKNLYDGKEYNESVNPADLTDCPECGDVSFDSKRGKCTKCSYSEELEESTYSQVPMLKLDDNNDFRFYVYSDEDTVVSDGFEYFEDAIDFAKENNHPLIKAHIYYRDEEDSKLIPDGDPKVVWDNGEVLLQLDYSILDESKSIKESSYKKGDRVELDNGMTGTVTKDFDWENEDQVAVEIDGIGEMRYPRSETLRSLKESFPRNIDLDQVVIQVANLVDDKALGDNWIEVFPTRDASQSSGGGYFIPLEITGPEDITKKATFRTRNGRVEVSFVNGSEAMCDSAESIARFIAGEFGLGLGGETPLLNYMPEEELQEGRMTDRYKAQVKKHFEDEIDSTDISHEIAEDGLSFTIVREDGTKLEFNAAGGYTTTKPEELKEEIATHLYLFPELTDEDMEMAKAYGLQYLGKNHGADGSEDNWVVAGGADSLRRFAEKWLGYELHPDYLYDIDSFAGEIVEESVNAGSGTEEVELPPDDLI